MAWENSRPRSNWRVLHPLMINRTSNSPMVNQVTTCEKFLEKFVAYYFFCRGLWDTPCIWTFDCNLYLAFVWILIHIGGIFLLLKLVLLGLYTSTFFRPERWLPSWLHSETCLCLDSSWTDGSRGFPCCCLLHTLYDLAYIAASLGHLCARHHFNPRVYCLISMFMSKLCLTCRSLSFSLTYPWFLVISWQVINPEARIDLLVHVICWADLVGGYQIMT